MSVNRDACQVAELHARLSAIIERTATRLCVDEDQALLRRAAQRSLAALEQLRIHMESGESESGDSLVSIWQPKLPPFTEEIAAAFLSEIDLWIRAMDHGFLQDRLHPLPEEQAKPAIHLLARVWGWIFCDLQDPLLQKYPHLSSF